MILTFIQVTSRPDMTIAVDWALNNNYLSIKSQVRLKFHYFLTCNLSDNVSATTFKLCMTVDLWMQRPKNSVECSRELLQQEISAKLATTVGLFYVTLTLQMFYMSWPTCFLYFLLPVSLSVCYNRLIHLSVLYLLHYLFQSFSCFLLSIVGYISSWNGKPRLTCVNVRHPPSKNSMGVLSWTCRSQRKWQST